MNELALCKERGLRELALFAGAGGGILGGHLLGWRTVAAVEIEDYPRRVLLQRQADGILPRFPIWDDVCTFDGKPRKGKVDVISGGFPCQDISAAGSGKGLEGARSGLWSEMFRIISEIQPNLAFVENSPMLTIRGLGTVLGDLASVGYDAKWCVLGADDVGACHHRKRIWILANSNSERFPRRENAGCLKKGWPRAKQQFTGFLTAQAWMEKARSGGFGEPDGVAGTMDTVKAIGNGQVPAVAALAWQILSEGLE